MFHVSQRDNQDAIKYNNNNNLILQSSVSSLNVSMANESINYCGGVGGGGGAAVEGGGG